ncbi:uncharacterized protein TNCV_361221 [Trichonephila clavipes]|nr:uncharacterized protein TNCV_361221 [Trichonephila clavipes]
MHNHERNLLSGIDALEKAGKVSKTSNAVDVRRFSTLLKTSKRFLRGYNDIPIDVVCHRYTLNMQVSSGSKNNSSPNEPSCTTETVSLGGNEYLCGALHIKVLRESECKLNLDTSENIPQDHCCGVHYACSLLQINHMRH